MFLGKKPEFAEGEKQGGALFHLMGCRVPSGHWRGAVKGRLLPFCLPSRPPAQGEWEEGEDEDEEELMYFHAAASTLSPSPSSQGPRGRSGVGRPFSRADALLLFKMELVPGSLEPSKIAMNFAKTAPRR